MADNHAACPRSHCPLVNLGFPTIRPDDPNAGQEMSVQRVLHLHMRQLAGSIARHARVFVVRPAMMVFSHPWSSTTVVEGVAASSKGERSPHQTPKEVSTSLRFTHLSDG